MGTNIDINNIQEHYYTDDFNYDERDENDFFNGIRKYNDKKKHYLSINWNYQNKEVIKLMTDETMPKKKLETQRYSYMWIEEIKQKCKWRKGEEIFICIAQPNFNHFNCFFSKKKKDIKIIDVKVSKKGYVYTKYFNEPEDEEEEKYIMLKPPCVYNDFIDFLIKYY